MCSKNPLEELPLCRIAIQRAPAHCGRAYHIGNFSRLDYQQAKVDFNADSAQYMKQQELLHTSRIQLNELMVSEDVDRPFIVEDSLINVSAKLNFDELWNGHLASQRRLTESRTEQYAGTAGL